MSLLDSISLTMGIHKASSFLSQSRDGIRTLFSSPKLKTSFHVLLLP